MTTNHKPGVLLPCPFCGGPNAVVRSNGIGDYYVICDGDEEERHCGASTSDHRCESPEHAVERWNTRPTGIDKQAIKDWINQEIPISNWEVQMTLKSLMEALDGGLGS